MSVGPTRCLVTGATGYIGARLVPRLLNEGHRVRALVRDPQKLADVPWRTRAEMAKGDLSDASSLIAAFDGVDVVYYLVHSMGSTPDFAAEEARAVSNVVTAACRTGVRRVVYLGGLHPDGKKLSPHLESRKAVGDMLIDSGIDALVLQAGVVVGSGSASFEMIRHLTDRLPVMTTPKWVHNKVQPIAVRDVLYYLVAAANAQVPASRTWDVGGPDVLEYGDMMRIYAEIAGLRKRRLIVLPFLTPTIASLWVGTVTPIPPGLARPLVESLECDAVMRRFDIDTIIAPPPDGLISYRRAVELALDRTARGLTDRSWATSESEPAESLPSDPHWAGEIVYSDIRCAVTTAMRDDIRKAIEEALNRGRWFSFPLGRRRSDSLARWTVMGSQFDTTLRLQAHVRSPGQAWLEITLSPADSGGCRYSQRAIFLPRGIVGRLYWLALRPAHATALRALVRKIADSDCQAVSSTTTAWTS